MARSAAHESLWRVRELMDVQYAQPLDLDELARAANFSLLGFELRQDAPLYPGATNRWVSVAPKSAETEVSTLD